MAYRGTFGGSVQDAYFDNFAEGYPGQIATRPDDSLIDGYPAEGEVKPGLAVVKGTDLALTANEYNNLTAPYTVKGTEAASVEADFVGIVVRTSGQHNDANGNPVYDDKDHAPVLREGRIFVTANQAISPADEVWLIVADNGGHGFEIGSFSNVDLGNADTIQLTKAAFWKAAAAGDVAIIELTR